MTKHTPGPWETSSNGIDWDVCMADGGDMIADLANCCVTEAEANARLIAAAPELLAAAQKAVCLALEKLDPVNGAAMRVILNEAIAKATGSTTKEG